MEDMEGYQESLVWRWWRIRDICGIILSLFCHSFNKRYLLVSAQWTFFWKCDVMGKEVFCRNRVCMLGGWWLRALLYSGQEVIQIQMNGMDEVDMWQLNVAIVLISCREVICFTLSKEKHICHLVKATFGPLINCFLFEIFFLVLFSL